MDEEQLKDGERYAELKALCRTVAARVVKREREGPPPEEAKTRGRAPRLDIELLASLSMAVTALEGDEVGVITGLRPASYGGGL